MVNMACSPSVRGCFKGVFKVKNLLGNFILLSDTGATSTGRRLPGTQVAAKLGCFVEDDVIIAPDVIAAIMNGKVIIKWVTI